MVPLVAAALIGGGASLLGNLVGGWMNNSAVDKTNKQNYELAMIQRGDTLRQNAFENKMGIYNMEFRNRQNNYQMAVDRRTEIRNKLAGDAAFRNNTLNMLNAANQLNSQRTGGIR